ncbi:unnamed protein product [Oncorhynchus mykiss]|uniref:Cortactin-binding protein-2 N-terminal domain-containing protein n=1 Tax=Oncorhynchus mykiss TaxID=8022 RepID=A0A060YP94_ONCMY|nr:unnamed protein product [Oncorhynchus mykiss]
MMAKLEGCATTPGLLSEVEQLRMRVVEMEGKDEELIRMGDQCRDLDRNLGRESSQSRSLKAEVDKLNGRISELDRLEEALGKSRQECSSLKGSLEKERASTKQLSGELDTLRVRVRELEAIEGQLEKSEGVLRQDFAKLRTLTVVVVEERKNMAERLRQTEEKLQEKKDGKLQAESDRVSTATEKLIEESRKALRSKAELEDRFQSVAKERDVLRVRLRAEEDRSGDLQSKVSAMKKRILILEVKKGESCREVKSPLLDNTNHGYQQEDNKVKELTQEVDRLRRRLMQKGVIEGELMKAEEDFESLERRCSKEQERARALAVELEESRRELSKYQLAEKKENNQEHLLLRRLQEEQVKSVLLKREDNHHPINCKVLNSNFFQKGDVMLAHTPGKPLHIKVTPDHGLNTAMLDISSPTTDNALSYTSTAVIPTSGASPKQRITIIPNAAISPVATTKNTPLSEGFGSPDRVLSPLIKTPVSVMSPASSRSVSPDHIGSPIQMLTVSTGSLESAKVIGQAVFRVSPERQNGWQLQRSDSTGPSIITTEDNKIHIHLGSPYIQSFNGITQSQSGGPYHTPGLELRTPVLTNGCHVKGNSKITSSITIAPANTPVSRPSHITVSGPYD